MLAFLAALGFGLLVVPLAGPAQQAGRQSEQQRCDLMENQYLRSILTATGDRITYISGPVLFVCEDGTRIRADSVVQFSADQFRELMGDVEIEGPETRVTADRIHLSTSTGRTQAWGDVEVVDDGADTRMVGDTLVFLEANELRPRDRLEMWGTRPYAVLRLEGEEAPDTTTDPENLPGRRVIGAGAPEDTVDTVAEPPPPPSPPAPDTVFADRLYLEGRTVFRAGGSVRVRREELEAFGDSLDYDRELGRALLVAEDSAPARIEGEEYDLVGRELNMLIQGSRIHRVDAQGRARLTGQDVRIEAPRVRVFLSDGEIERLVAVDRGRDEGSEAEVPDSVAVPSRAEAVAEDFVLRADSIEVQAPGRSLDRVVAVGGARGESLGRDSLNAADTPESIRRDWIEGDTVVAHFVQGDSADPVDGPPADTTGTRSRLDRLVATGSARSLYRMARRDSASDAAADTAGTSPDSARADGRLAVHYVVGDRITITLREGDVERMEVMGQTRGLYLEPRRGRPVSPSAPDTVPRPPVVSRDAAPEGTAGGGDGT